MNAHPRLRLRRFLLVLAALLPLGVSKPDAHADAYSWGGPNNQGGNGDFNTAGWDDLDTNKINSGPPGAGDSAYIPEVVLTCSGGGVETLEVATDGGVLDLTGGFSVTNLGSVTLTGSGNLSATNLQPVSVAGASDSAEAVNVTGAHITIDNVVQGNINVSGGGSGVVKGDLPIVSAAIVTDPMSTMEIDGSMTQGSAANGAKFTAGSIMNSGISTESVTADGAGTVFSVTGSAEFDGHSFEITNGATAAVGSDLNLYTHQQTSLGIYGGGNVYLDGAGSTLTVGGKLAVGAGPSPTDPQVGSLGVSNGAVLHVNTVGIDGNGQSGTMAGIGVNSGSQMQVDAGIAVGVDASASLGIGGGSGVTMTGTVPVLAVGLNAGGQGQITVSGDGSFLNANDTLVSVAHAANTKGDIEVDTNASLVVGGPGPLAEPPYLHVGDGGAGTMEVSSGATLQVLGALSTFELGSQAGSSGSVALDSGNAVVLQGPVVVGNQGTGVLGASGAGTVVTASGGFFVGGDDSDEASTGRGTFSVSGGAQATIGAGGASPTHIGLGNGAGSQGEIYVSDAGSVLTLNGLTIAGVFGDGELAAINGATAQSTGLQLGGAADAVGALLVYDPGTVWTENQGLIVGGAASHHLSGVAVNDGGLLRVRNLLNITSEGIVTVTIPVVASVAFPFPPSPSASPSNGRIFVGTDDFGPDGAIRVGTGGVLKGKGKQAGTGVVNASVVGKVVVGLGGKFQPGGDPDVFSITGDCDLSDGGAGGGETDFEIGGAGTAGTDYDQLVVSGTATLGGTLKLVLLPGYVPKVGDTFNFIQAGAVAGNFAQIVAPGLTVNPVAGSGGQSVAVTAVTAFTAPLITSNAAATAYAGTPFSYQIIADESPAGYAASGLPDGLSIDPATGLISGSPTAAGTYVILLSATNAAGTGTSNLTLTVNAALPPGTPVITSATSVQGQVGVPFTYQIMATNSPTSFGAAGLPPGLTIDPATGIISGTPGPGAAFSVTAVFTVTLSATNASGTSTLALAVAISPAALPTVTVAATTPVAHLSDDQPGVFTFNISTPQSTKTIIKYLLKGSAVNGTDYELLSGKAKIKPGHSSASVQIVPRGNLGGAESKKVKLVIEPSSAFTVGTTTAAKVKIKP